MQSKLFLKTISLDAGLFFGKFRRLWARERVAGRSQSVGSAFGRRFDSSTAGNAAQFDGERRELLYFRSSASQDRLAYMCSLSSLNVWAAEASRCLWQLLL